MAEIFVVGLSVATVALLYLVVVLAFAGWTVRTTGSSGAMCELPNLLVGVGRLLLTLVAIVILL